MNRKERRIAAKRGADTSSIADLFAEAQRHYRQGAAAQAEALCEQILSREPGHVASLNLLGLVAQASGRHRLAVKMLAKAVIANARDAACHYNLASSYQALDQRDQALEHFRRAIALGLSGRNAEEFIVQSPVVGACLARLDKKWPLPVSDAELFGSGGLAAIASDLFLQAALQSVLIRNPPIEAFLTQLRNALLRLDEADGDVAALSCALAQQCFINEYVYAQGEDEIRQAARLRDDLLQQIAGGSEIAPLTLAAVGSYFPLHALDGADRLLSKDWPDSAAALVRQQVREPLEELRDRPAIPALTPVDDAVSLQVMQQYEENPYPRWTVNPHAALAGTRKMSGRADEQILIAGCGTGKHPIEIAQWAPAARVLAVDISRVSLAYARRKTREEGVANIEYAQADVLKLGGIGRTFDVIECVGVLHHLADPKAGWRALLPLLKPDGQMCIGLYSEAARRDIVEARAFIAERGFSATPDSIRECRQEILRGGTRRRWQALIATGDFWSMSGCRDLIFNVMEHRFTIPQIKAFLAEENLTFLGFELSPEIADAFARNYPGAALTDLDQWNEFETANPMTFRDMYKFWVRKSGR